jgi:predicted ATP-grasp superfamily ATP-dependent carboligase
MSMPVLISDGSFKHTLAMVRSMGRKDIYTTVTASTPIAQSFYSKYCTSRCIVPPPSKQPEAFMKAIAALLHKNKHVAYLPVGWYANFYASKYKSLLERYTSVPVADFDSMTIAAYKDKTMSFAEGEGVNIPQTYIIHDEEDLSKIARNLEFPVVIKASTASGSVYYPNSEEELREYYLRLKDESPVVQEYIQGEGYGFFALYDQGECRAHFMHKRIREYPITGGPSVAAQAYYSSSLKKEGMKILDGLHWNGVAMVEFKKDVKDRKFKLMEINPKFWGSLELAISAGIDFPYLAYQLATGNSFRPNPTYNRKAKFRWPFPGDLLYSISTGSIMRFISDFGNKQFEDDICLEDLGPLTMQCILTLNELRKGIRSR